RPLVMPLPFLCCFFLCFTWRPPPSPLFPYTTLFRSVPKLEWTSNMAEETFLDGVAACQEYIRAGDAFQIVLSQRFATRTTADGVDRKSTRLNSSHVKISYAVFCLKKKRHKKTEIRHD